MHTVSSHHDKPLWQRVLTSRAIASLTYPHDIDSIAESLNPAWSLRRIKARITAVSHPTADSVSLSLRANHLWQGFSAGQFVPLSVEIDGVRRTRCYSPTNAESRDSRSLELTIKAHDGGQVSNFLKRSATAGMIVELGEAAGEFMLPARRPAALLLISGGSGITPVMSMLRTLIVEKHAGEISFVHYAKSLTDIPFRAELDALAARHDNIRLRYVLSEQGGGRFSQQQIAELAPNYAQAQTWVCGPASLMQAVEVTWAAIARSQALHQERFTALAPSSVSDTGGELSFQRSGTRATADGRNLLEQAEAAGLAPAHGCRMGICSTCTCTKVSGSVRNLLSGEVCEEAGVPIRICVSAPVGDVTLDI